MLHKYIKNIDKHVFLYQKVLNTENNIYGYIKYFDIYNINSILIKFDNGEKKLYTESNYDKLYFIF
jgi:hypothetical protein